MNFKDIENFLKNNYKIMIICVLVYLLMSNKSENFTVTEALDSMKATEKKVNDAFSKVDKNMVEMKKQLHMDNIFSLNGKAIRLKNSADANHAISYNKDIDGPEIKGHSKIKLTAKNGVFSSVSLSAPKLCVGATCINENDLKKMKSSRMIGGWAGNGDGSTHMLEEGGWHELHGRAKYDLWSNDKWDFAFIYRGWRFELAEDKKGGKPQKFENKKHNVMKCGIKSNKGSSYRLTWIGY